MKRFLSATIAIVLSVVGSTCALAASSEGRESLVGLAGVMLHVQEVDPQLERYLPGTSLKTRIEMRLRAGGVPILTEAEDAEIAKTAGARWHERHAELSFDMTALKVGDEYFLHLELEVGQLVWVPDKKELVSIVGTTWEAGRYGAYRPHHLDRGDLVPVVDAIVDEFIDVWRATHPDAVASQKHAGAKE